MFGAPEGSSVTIHDNLTSYEIGQLGQQSIRRVEEQLTGQNAQFETWKKMADLTNPQANLSDVMRGLSRKIDGIASSIFSGIMDSQKEVIRRAWRHIREEYFVFTKKDDDRYDIMIAGLKVLQKSYPNHPLIVSTITNIDPQVLKEQLTMEALGGDSRNLPGVCWEIGNVAGRDTLRILKNQYTCGCFG